VTAPIFADDKFKTDLCNLIPVLRAFARGLAGRRDIADDLAQEALAKAWQARGSYAPGTNLKAWLFTILRNQFYSDCRRSWRQSAWDQDAAEQIPGSPDQQMWTAELSDTTRALTSLPDEQREAMILIAAGGLSYEEAAAICNCAVGTIKSRVSRARSSLVEMLEGRLPTTAARRDAAEGAASDRIMSELARLLSRSRPVNASVMPAHF
jgi:RNA polymerase sigma-70 factor (ECF subfamily)